MSKLATPQTAEEVLVLLEASIQLVKLRRERDEALLDEVARRRGVEPWRARAIRNALAEGDE
jgi:hypothetical protein